jgi:pSer/pThr/pTyr-binding forkhead associated (FHA) protein
MHMRIEVLVGSEEPLIFPLNNPKFSLGTGEGCDVILSSSGISRKHLVITSEDDKFYVTDQGSTNGSFINEERLIPGKKSEFTSFFPVRLGDNVLVSLLSDEEDVGDYSSIEAPKERNSPRIELPERSDSTTVINLKDLKKVKTETLVLERNQKREIRKKTAQASKVPVKPKKKTNYVGWFAILIVAAAGYYNFVLLKNADDKEQVREVGKIVGDQPTADTAANTAEVLPAPTDDLVEESALPKKEFITGLLNNPKCTIDVEIAHCEMFPESKTGQFGVVQVGLSVHVLIDGTPYFEEAKQYVKDHEDKDLLRKTAAYAFFAKKVPVMDLNYLGENRMIITLFRQTDTGHQADTVIAFKPEVWNRVKGNWNPAQLNSIRSIGLNAISSVDKYYSVY